MIHATRSRRPEIVLFGARQRFLTPLAINAGNEVMITSHAPGEITVSKFSAAEPDQKRVVSTEVDAVIRAVVELGGTYPDIVQALQEAKAAEVLPSRFEVDALPESGRTYERHLVDAGEAADEAADEADAEDAPSPTAGWAGSPRPELFHRQSDIKPASAAGLAEESGEKTASDQPDSEGKSRASTGFFARIMGLGSD